MSRPERGFSKILRALFGCLEKLLLDNLRRRRTFSFEAEMEVVDDSVNGFMILDEGDDLHLASA